MNFTIAQIAATAIVGALLLVAFRHLGRRIMGALDNLSTTLDGIASDVTSVKTEIDSLTAAAQANDLTAVQQKADAIKASLDAIAQAASGGSSTAATAASAAPPAAS